MILSLQQLVLQQIVVTISNVDSECSFFSTWILGDVHALVALNDTFSWNTQTRMLFEMPTAVITFTSIALDSLVVAIDDTSGVLWLLTCLWIHLHQWLLLNNSDDLLLMNFKYLVTIHAAERLKKFILHIFIIL